MAEITFSDIFDSMLVILSQTEVLRVFGYMLAVSMLVGGVLDWSERSYWLYFVTAFVGVFFTEWIRIEYFMAAGLNYTPRPIALVILSFSIYALGVLLGTRIVELTRNRNNNIEDTQEILMNRIEEEIYQMKNNDN